MGGEDARQSVGGDPSGVAPRAGGTEPKACLSGLVRRREAPYADGGRTAPAFQGQSCHRGPLCAGF